ncbi:hypothetical protein N7488_004722 [Penicillium malachiteum]|nr:hypothetical protein N7488_004722 [Penicillium malachiteum]
MAGGWRNPIMQDEIGFIICESIMCAVAVIALCIAHPGYCFKQMRGGYIQVTTDDATLLAHQTGFKSAA